MCQSGLRTVLTEAQKNSRGHFPEDAWLAHPLENPAQHPGYKQYGAERENQLIDVHEARCPLGACTRSPGDGGGVNQENQSEGQRKTLVDSTMRVVPRLADSARRFVEILVEFHDNGGELGL